MIRIILVEDNPLDAAQLVAAFNRAGVVYQLAIAPDVDFAEALIAIDAPDVVVCDRNLPGEKGDVLHGQTGGAPLIWYTTDLTDLPGDSGALTKPPADCEVALVLRIAEGRKALRERGGRPLYTVEHNTELAAALTGE